MKHVAVLWNPAYSDFKADWRELRAAAKTLGIDLHPVKFRHPDDLDAAFAAIARERVDALITFSDVLTYIYAKRQVFWLPSGPLAPSDAPPPGKGISTSWPEMKPTRRQ